LDGGALLPEVRRGRIVLGRFCDGGGQRAQEWLADKLEMKSEANVSQPLRRLDGKSALNSFLKR
jgi:hypothetical protein